MFTKPAVQCIIRVLVWIFIALDFLGMDDKQADSEKIGGGRNVVPEKNVAHTMDSEENK